MMCLAWLLNLYRSRFVNRRPTYRLRSLLVATFVVAVGLFFVRQYLEFQGAVREFDAIIKTERDASVTQARLRELVLAHPQLAQRRGGMIWAAQFGDIATNEVFLGNGANVNERGRWWKETPLVRAVWRNDVRLAELFLRYGADKHIRLRDTGCPDGATLLDCSSRLGSLEMSQLLVREGLDVNDPAETGCTPLHAAIASGNVDVVRFLLQQGAKTSARMGNGFDPLDLANYLAKCESLQINGDPRYAEIVEEIVKYDNLVP